MMLYSTIMDDKQNILASILENTVEAVVACDAKGVLTYFNRTAIEMHGLPAISIAPEKLTEYYSIYRADGKTIMPKEELPLFRALYGETVNNVEAVIAPKNRKPILVRVNGRPIQDSKGNITGAVVTFLDITESKLIHQELNNLNRELEERVIERTNRLNFLDRITSPLLATLDHEEIIYQIAVAGLPFMADGCFIDLVTSDGIQRLVTKHHDQSSEQLMKVLKTRYPPNYSTPHPSSEAIRTGRPQLWKEVNSEIITQYAQDKGHAELVTELNIRSILAVPIISRNTIIGALTLILTTDRKLFDEEDLSTTTELARRLAIAIENSRLYAHAQSAIKQRDEFISIASHELKTPITSLKLQLEAISRSISKSYIQRIDHEYMQKFSHSSLKQLDRLSRLVEDMLDISRIRTGRLALQMKRSDLSEICREVLARFNDQLANQNIAIEQAILDKILIQCDPYRIEQVITNLMTNAIRYGEKKPINFCLKQVGQNAVLSIQDFGRGIDPIDHDRIFNRFERAIGPTDISGLGLGLYISRQIAEEHGGQIKVESQLGQGSTFIFTIPLYE